MTWKVKWKVSIDGVDMTSAMRPYLTNITVTDKADAASDTCSLSFDDRDGQVLLPQTGAKVVVELQGVEVFNGITDTVRSSGSKSSGRTLSVSAKGFDAHGPAKQPQVFHKDDASLKDFLGKAATDAGLELVIDPAFGKIARDYWSAEGESVLQLGQRLAGELHGTFKIKGGKAVLAKRGQGLSPGGAPMPTIKATYGDNLIDWDIAPKTTRRKFGSAEVRYFDRKSATQKVAKLAFTGDGPVNLIRSFAANKEQAEGIAEARERESDREGGEGSVTIDIAPQAQAEGALALSGAREGVDGDYRIESVTHSASRGGGSTTKLSLKQPAGAAGTDNRKT